MLEMNPPDANEIAMFNRLLDEHGDYFEVTASRTVGGGWVGAGADVSEQCKIANEVTVTTKVMHFNGDHQVEKKTYSLEDFVSGIIDSDLESTFGTNQLRELRAYARARLWIRQAGGSLNALDEGRDRIRSNEMRFESLTALVETYKNEFPDWEVTLAETDDLQIEVRKSGAVVSESITRNGDFLFVRNPKNLKPFLENARQEILTPPAETERNVERDPIKSGFFQTQMHAGTDAAIAFVNAYGENNPDEPLVDFYLGYASYIGYNAGENGKIWHSIECFNRYIERAPDKPSIARVLKMQGENYRHLVLSGEPQYRVRSAGFLGAYLFYHPDDREARAWFDEMLT